MWLCRRTPRTPRTPGGLKNNNNNNKNKNEALFTRRAGGQGPSPGTGTGTWGRKLGLGLGLRATSSSSSSSSEQQQRQRGGSTLVVVESPTKAKKVAKFVKNLGGTWEVLASYGHVRDLVAKEGAVDVNVNVNGNEEQNGAGVGLKWHVNSRQRQRLDEIKLRALGADRVLLATDPDREGEGIAWHLKEELLAQAKGKGLGNLGEEKIERITFNEVTKQAVLDSLSNARDISFPLVDAYRARRALDHLVGFNLSPVLWRKLPGSKSAGRVQSAALRMICERDDAISKFIPEEYWSVNCDVNVEGFRGHTFDSHLTMMNGTKLKKFSIVKEDEADRAVNLIKVGSILVQNIKESVSRKSPRRPLSTSTLQQLASSRLGMTVSETMLLAQKLYEGDHSSDGEGLITYMRTDGTYLAPSFLNSARSFIQDEFGEDYLPEAPRMYTSRSKNAQEAHEAIRPTNVRLTPASLAKKMDPKALKLYDLIWSTSVACQMTDARIKTLSFDFGDDEGSVLLRSSMSAVIFPGHQALFKEREEGNRQNAKLLESMAQLQPKARCKTSNYRPLQHHTSPPPKFSDGSLVKALEEEGIGRPSTYAPIIQVLMSRSYIVRSSGRLVPTPRGHLVTTFLKHYFEKYVDYKYTSGMEEKLDKISNNELDWTFLLKKFWLNFEPNVSDVLQIRNSDIIDELDRILGDSLLSCLDLDSEDKRQCPSCQSGTLGLKLSMYGGFVGCSNYRSKSNPCNFGVPLDMCFDSSKALAKHEFDPNSLGLIGEDDEKQFYMKLGPFGYYIRAELKGDGEDIQTISLPKNVEPRDVDLVTAETLASLPKVLGEDSDKNEVFLGTNSYGMFVQCQNVRARLPAKVSTLELTLEDALVLIEEKGKVVRAKPGTSGSSGKKKAAKGGRARSGGRSKTKAGGGSKAKGKKNAFIAYMQDNKNRVVKDNPDKNWQECLKIIASEWKEVKKEKVSNI